MNNKINIRNFNTSDYPMVLSWWKNAKEIPPSINMLPEDSTFIIEYEDKSVACLTVYLTNSKEISYFENFVKNPNIEKDISKQMTQYLVEYVCEFTKTLGYKRIICMSYKEPLKKRYSELGFFKTLDNISTLVKEL